MAQLIIPVQAIPPGAERHSVSRTIPAITRDVTIQLTDSGDWATVTGNILIWGLQISTDGGTTWAYRISQTNIPFGQVNKSHTLPSFRESGADVVADAGHLARLAIQVDTTINLGATISTV